MSTFESILDLVISENLTHIGGRLHMKDLYTPEDFLKEFCTVRLDFGRSVGKTTAIANRATSNDLVITFDAAAYEFLRANSIFSPTYMFREVDRSLIGALSSYRFDRVWVDEPNMIENLSYVYDIAATTKARQVILIG